MLNPHHYSTTLLKSSKDSAELVYWIDALANLVLAKKTILKAIPVKELTVILTSLNCPEVIKNIVLLMIENNDTALLPRVAATLRRQLIQVGKPVADVSIAKRDRDIEAKIAQALGTNYTVVFQANPSLIAGIRISSTNFTFESSVASRLNDVKKALS